MRSRRSDPSSALRAGARQVRDPPPYNASVPVEPGHLPTPPLEVSLDVPPPDSGGEIDFLALPTQPGVFLFENEAGGCLTLAITSDLRRLIRARLEPGGNDRPTRRINFRHLTRRIRAITVGSAFEADWAYLQLARQHLPTTYAAMLDRWPAWFVHVNPETDFPRWTKTPRPFTPPTGESGRYFGPIPDKHAAARYIETIEDAFDLCRYYHILIEAPNASACAYKEMGRCPAPCDGTISMDAYRSMMTRASEFAARPLEEALAGVEKDMADAAGALDFERAERLKTFLQRLEPTKRTEFARVRALEDFAYLGLYPSERDTHARLFLILGGWITPFADVPLDADDAAARELASALNRRRESTPAQLRGSALENLGLVCRHLFRPKNDRRPGTLIDLDAGVDPARLRRALGKLRGDHGTRADDDAVDERVFDALS